MEEEVSSLTNKIEILEKENYDLKTENKNLKKLVSMNQKQTEGVEFTTLKNENQKLRRMIEHLKVQSSREIKYPSSNMNQEKLNEKFYNKIRKKKNLLGSYHQGYSANREV